MVNMNNRSGNSSGAFREGVDWNWKNELWLSFDTEATGVSTSSDRVFEVGLVVGNGNVGVIETMGFLINPGGAIPEEVEQLTGITTDMVKDKRSFAEHAALLEQFFFHTTPVLVGYNALAYDVPLLEAEFERVGLGKPVWPMVVDPLLLLRGLNKDLRSYKLEQVAQHFGVRLEDAHRAVDDAAAALGVLAAIAPMLPERAGELAALQQEMAEQLQAEKQRYGFWLKEMDGGELVMARGKHLGTPLAKMDGGYLTWMLTKIDDLPDGARDALKGELKRRK